MQRRPGPKGGGGMMPERPTMARLHAREGLLLAALLSGKGLADAAAAAGVSRRTGLRMRTSPEFQTALKAARDEMLGAVVDKLRTDAADYASTLHGIATDTKGRGSDRVLASRHGLDLMLRGVETLDLVQRVDALEKVAGSR